MAILTNNPEITSTVIALAVVYFLGQRVFRKYKLGLITSMEFTETKLKLGLLNTMTGAHKEIDLHNLNIGLHTRISELFSKQRIVEIYEHNVLVNRLNIELTAWCRHPEIEALVVRLEELKRRSST